MINQINIEYPLWSLIIPIAVGLLFAALLYVKNKHNKLSAAWTVSLFGLRFLSTALIALLLLSPFIKTTKKHIQKPKLLFAIDNSRSMLYSSDSTFLQNNFKAKLQNLQNEFAGDFQIENLLFGQNVTPFDSLSFSEDASDYSQLFKYINEHYQSNELEAMILIGDGIFNSGADPFYASESIDFPIFALSVGDTITKPDVWINDIKSNSLVYLNENIPLELNFSAIGLINRNVSVNVFVGSKLFKTRSVKINNSNFNKTERFDLNASKQGKLRIRVELLLNDEESNKSNNNKSIYVDVLNAKQKILILANSPHPDISALKQAISAFKNYEVDIVFEGTQNYSLGDYSLVILHQLPSLQHSISQTIKEINRLGLPILNILGEQSNLNASGVLFETAMFNSVVRSFENSRASFNQNFPLFNLKDLDISLLEDLPPLKVPLGNFQNVNSSNVLAWQNINGINTNFPLFYFSENEGIKRGLIMGEGLWLWRNYTYLEKSNFISFNNLIGKTVQYLMVKADKRYFRIKNEGEYYLNDKIELEAELYNNSYEPIVDAEIDLKLTNERGEMFDYIFSPMGNAYNLILNNIEPGMYSYSAKSKYLDKKYSEKGDFVVLQKNLELQQLLVNNNLLFKLTERNNGFFTTINNMDTIINVLGNTNVKNRISYSQTYSGLNNIPLILVLILLLLSLEWGLRKYLGNY